MSFEATTWALNIDGVQDATSRVILLGLAEHAGKDGSAAWPSVATLAAYAVCSPRTVHRRLRELEDAGMIQRGDQRLVEHIPAGRRPVVYDLPVGVSIWHAGRGDNMTGVSPETGRGDTRGSAGVSAVADKPSLIPYGMKPSDEHVGDADATPRRDDVIAVCDAVADHVELVTGKRPTAGKRWQQQARLMLDADGRSVDEVRAMVTWVTAHGFWSPNILSVPKLREKWPTLVAQRGSASGGGWAAQEMQRAAAFAAGGAG